MLKAREGPHPPLFVSADSTGVTGEFFVSADSKGVISPLFPADPRRACKCGLYRSCGRGVLEVGIIKELVVSDEVSGKNEMTRSFHHRGHRDGEKRERGKRCG